MTSEKFLGCADEWQEEAACRQPSSDSRLSLGVGDVSAAPGEEVVHHVDRGHGDVEAVFRCTLREQAPSQELLAKGKDVGCQEKERKTLERYEPALGGLGVTGLGLTKHELRNSKIEGVAPKAPPLKRNLLVSSSYEIPAGTRGQIADDRRFEIDAPFHEGSLSERRPRAPPNETMVSGERKRVPWSAPLGSVSVPHRRAPTLRDETGGVFLPRRSWGGRIRV